MKPLTLTLFAVSLGWAQSSWLTSHREDSNAVRDRQTLTLRGFYLSSSTVRPSITLVCRGGKLVSSSFNTYLFTRGQVPIHLAGPAQKLAVSVRIGENKQEHRLWKIAGGDRSFRPDSEFVRKLVSADRVDVGFWASPSLVMTAEFKPSPADAPRIKEACGIH